MTNQEIIAAQRRHRELLELARTLPADLRVLASGGATPGQAVLSRLLADAAELIDFLNQRIARAQQDAKENDRDARQAAGAAYSEGRHDGAAEATGGW